MITKKPIIVFVVTVVFSVDAGVFGEELIGVTQSKTKAFELLDNYDAVKAYKDMFFEGTLVNESKVYKDFDADETGNMYYSETMYMHGDEDATGVIVKTIYKKELV